MLAHGLGSPPSVVPLAQLLVQRPDGRHRLHPGRLRIGQHRVDLVPLPRGLFERSGQPLQISKSARVWDAREDRIGGKSICTDLADSNLYV